MSNFSEIPPTAERMNRKQSAEDAKTYFRRRTLSNRRCLCPRRYVMAFMLFVLLLVGVLRKWNITFTVVYIVMSEEAKIDYPTIGNWTIAELDNIGTYMLVGDIFVNLLGGLLIYQFSSHKFLLLSSTLSYFLHILTPTALNHHSVIFLIIVMIGQEILSVPIRTAVLSMWKDWAPPEERTRLVTISLCGIGFEAISSIFFFFIIPPVFERMSYYVGIAGLLWALFWYNSTADIPQNDPLISENEFLYLESKIPSNYQEKINLKDVPWKSMIKSKQILILCSVFFKLACSVKAIQINGLLFAFHLTHEYNTLFLFIPFMATFLFILIGSSFLMDILLQKYRDKTLAIRRIFLCSSFVLQSVFLLGAAILSSQYVQAIFYVLANSIFALSIPGTLRYPLDLSPRYVSIIAGVGYGFFGLGMLCTQEFAEHAFELSGFYVGSSLLFYDGILSLCTAIIFGIWSDVEEQPWSLLTSSQRRGNDYRSYPQPDDEDDINLVSGNVL